MVHKPGDNIVFQFTTRPLAGSIADADSLPTGTLVRNGVDTAEAVTVTDIGVGRYRASATIPAGWARGDVVGVRIAATVGGISDEAILFSASLVTDAEHQVTQAAVAANGAAIAALHNLSAADVRGAVGLASPDLDAQLADIQAGVDGLDTDGNGAEAVVLNVKTAGGDPVAGADVWITTDSVGQDIVAGTVKTDAFGNTPTLHLDPGTYYRWAQISGYEFTNPLTFTVEAS